MHTQIYLFFILITIAAPAPAAAVRQTVDGVELFVDPRTPAQLEGFYSARGLPPQAIEEIKHYCFITVGVHNHRDDVVWLLPDRWRITDARGRQLHRVARARWDARWQALNVAPAARSAFGWTQLPDARDLQTDEPVGGNFAIERPSGAFTLVAIFPIGSAKGTRSVRIPIEHLRCAEDENDTVAEKPNP